MLLPNVTKCYQFKRRRDWRSRDKHGTSGTRALTSYGIEFGTFCLLICDLSSDVATSTERTASNGMVFSE
jgi:hypothetical protein